MLEKSVLAIICTASIALWLVLTHYAASGTMLTGEIKAKCIEQLQIYVKAFQERRAQVTDDTVNLFMSQRPLEWKGNPLAKVVVPVREAENADAPEGEGGDGKLTKNQLKKIEKQKQLDAKKAQKAKEKAEADAAKAAAE